MHSQATGTTTALAFLIPLLLVGCAATALAEPSAPVDVRTRLGTVRGFALWLRGPNRIVDVFFGVPFAKAPVGALRLEKPQPVERWPGLRLAVEPSPACIYHAWPEGLAKGRERYSEDCLYLNIFAPHAVIKKSNRSGGFEVGSSDSYQNYEDVGTKFVSQGIVVVSIQYRLGWIGFGSTGDAEMPGNLGLWDQRAALQWVRENIAAFGGDRARVTLFGYSAGSASVSLLAISPKSSPLFHRAIEFSGSPMAQWALNERTVNETFALARELGCGESSRSVRKCIGERPVTEVWKAMERLGNTRPEDVNFARFQPRVDGDFLPADVPELIRTAAPKPTVMGFVDLESLLWTLFSGRNSTLAAYAIPWEEVPRYSRDRFEQSIRQVVAKQEDFAALAEQAQREIVQFYEDPFGEYAHFMRMRFPDFYVQRYTQVLSDLQFIVSILLELELKVQAGWPVHFYQNAYCNDKVFPKADRVHQNFHTGDLNYLFRESHFPFNFPLTEEDLLVEEVLVQIVRNFVKQGDPSPDGVPWMSANQALPHRHLQIGPAPVLVPQLGPDVHRRLSFWKLFLRKYGAIWNPLRGAKDKAGQ